MSKKQNSKMAAIEEGYRVETRRLQNLLESARKANDAERHAAIKRMINVADWKFKQEKSRAEGAFNIEINKLAADRQHLLDQQVDDFQKQRADAKPLRNKLDERERQVYEQYTRQQDALQKQQSDLDKSEAEALTKLTEKRRLRDNLADQIKQEEAAYRIITAESQLHRIASPLASWWEGKEYEPHTVRDQQVRRVAVVWFGSMAALGALGGAVVAMVSQLLLRHSNETKSSGGTSLTRPLSGALRFFGFCLCYGGHSRGALQVQRLSKW